MYKSYKQLYPDTRNVKSGLFHYFIYGWREGRYLPIHYLFSALFTKGQIKKSRSSYRKIIENYELKEFNLYRRLPNSFTVLILHILFLNKKKFTSVLFLGTKDTQTPTYLSIVEYKKFKSYRFYINRKKVELYDTEDFNGKQLIVINGINREQEKQVTKQINIHASNIKFENSSV